MLRQARKRRLKRWTDGFLNRRMARMHAETLRGIECGLGFFFRRGSPRR